MRRTCIAAFILCSCVFAYAEVSFSLGLSPAYSMYEDFEDDGTLLYGGDMSGLGANLEVFIGKGLGFQFYADVGTALAITQRRGPIERKAGAADLGTSAFAAVALNVAYRFRADRFAATVGAGIGGHAATVSTDSEFLGGDPEFSIWYSTVQLGPDIVLACSYRLSDSFGLYLSAHGMYDILQVLMGSSFESDRGYALIIPSLGVMYAPTI